MKRSTLIPLAILGIAGALAFAAWRRNTQANAGEGAAAPAQGFDKLFDSLFGGGAAAPAPAPAPAQAPAPAPAADNGT